MTWIGYDLREAILDSENERNNNEPDLDDPGQPSTQVGRWAYGTASHCRGRAHFKPTVRVGFWIFHHGSLIEPQPVLCHLKSAIPDLRYYERRCLRAPRGKALNRLELYTIKLYMSSESSLPSMIVQGCSSTLP